MRSVAIPVCRTDHGPREGPAARSPAQGVPEDLSHPLPPLYCCHRAQQEGGTPGICQLREAEYELLLIFLLQGWHFQASNDKFCSSGLTLVVGSAVTASATRQEHLQGQDGVEMPLREQREHLQTASGRVNEGVVNPFEDDGL